MSDNQEINTSPKTGLDFEISLDAPTDMVLPPDAEVIEIDVDDELPETSRNEVEFSEFDIPETFSGVGSGNFILDTNDRPTYMPRFTEVSDNYRMRDDIRDRMRAAATSDAENTEEKPENTIPPEEQQPLRHIVINQNSPVSPANDESITIIKFDDVPVAREEEQISEEDRAAGEIVSALAEVIDVVPPTVEDVTPEPEETPEVAPEEVPLPVIEYEDIPEDDIRLIEYSLMDNHSESLRPEYAPNVVDETKKRGEFTSNLQRDKIKDRFLDSIMSVKIRLISAIVLIVAMLALDITSRFGIDLISLMGLGGVIGARAIVDAQFAIALFLLALPEFIRAVRLIFAGGISPELILLPSLATVLVHSLIVVLTAGTLPAFGILFGIQVVVAILSAYHRISAEFTSFKVVSRPGVKKILDKRLTRTLAEENAALDGAIDEYKSKIARMFRTAFVADFMSRSAKVVENSVHTLAMALVSLFVALVSGVVSYFVAGGEVGIAATAFSTVFLLSFPVFSMLIHKLAYHRFAGSASSAGSAFVGEGSLYSCSDIDVIAYDDAEVFGEDDVSIKNMDIYGTQDISTVMLEMKALFSAIGGPLAGVFALSVGDNSPTAEDVLVEIDGVCGIVYGRKVYAGTAEYMKRHHISVPEEEKHTAMVDSTRAMYGAEDCVVHAVFHIRYSFSEEFTMLLPRLREEGIVPLIYTRDPNLTNEFMKVFTYGEDVIRIMKKPYHGAADDKIYRRVSAGIVTLGDKLSAVNMVLLSKKYTTYQAKMSRAEIISLVLGLIISLSLAFSGSTLIPVSALALWQILECIFIYVKTALSSEKKKDTN